MSDRVQSRWDEAEAPQDPVDLLVYASNLLGSDPRITNYGGGNTSSKVPMPDPLTGETVEVLWVKASGGDLGSAKRGNFASLYLDKVLGIEEAFKRDGRKEDEAVPLYAQATFNLNPAAPSIDTPLHAYVPFQAVSHMHSDAIIALAASEDQVRLTEEVFGGRMGYVPWKRPGLDLGLMIRDELKAKPGIQGAMMGQHGFICWADDWKTCYELTLEFINLAVDYLAEAGQEPFGAVVRDRHPDPKPYLTDLLSRLRGKVAYNGLRQIAHVDTDEVTVDFISRAKMPDLAKLGTSCPDHFLRTKIRPLVLEPGADLDAALDGFRWEYGEYYSRCAHPNSPAMRNPNPSVVLIPGVGMVAFNKNAKEARVTGEFYRNAIEVMRGAEAASVYEALPEKEAFDIEYWLLEEAKLQRMPAEKEMARKIVLLIGAGPGIGRQTAERLLAQDATVVIADLQSHLVEEAVGELGAKFGKDNIYGTTIDITDRSSVRAALDATVLRYGGLDVLVNIAAVFFASDTSGRLDDDRWKKTYDINLVGSYIVADEAAKTMRAQGLGGSLVLVSSANALVAKKGSVAYDTSKAAVNHLVRELAVEYAPDIRVNAVAPATVVAGSQMFPRDRVLASLAKYNIEHDESQSDDELRDRLADFYAQRTLLKKAVTPGRVADALYLLASDRLGFTTGHVLPVDAGLADAFLR
ncbi:bifunctional rhamnulose-1-phosphate aldolase/short-chain dehydrogenase [soil metagenome]